MLSMNIYLSTRMIIGQGSWIRNTMSMSPACSALEKFERAAEVCLYIYYVQSKMSLFYSRN